MTLRTRLVMGVAAALVLAGCAPATDTAGIPWCDDFTVLILEAQSAPGAQLLPCIELMPLGWTVSDTHIDDEGTAFSLHSSIAGSDAARVTLTRACTVAGYIPVPTDEPGTLRYELVSIITDGFRGRRVYEFDGGCTTIDFEFDVDVSASLVNEVSLALGFISRDEVNDAVRTVTGGDEQVDPPADG